MRLPLLGSSELRDELAEARERIESLEEELESWKERYEAESERRSELAAEKQELDEKLKKERQRVENLKQQTEEEEGERRLEFSRMDAEKAFSALESLQGIDSEGWVTVLSPGDLQEMPDVKGLRNTLSSGTYAAIREVEGAILCTDQKAVHAFLRARPFFQPDWNIGAPDFSSLLEFYRERKTWAAVSAGDSMVIEEESGEIVSVEEVSSRVDSDHSSGGYSQSRFERKRERQIEEHLDQLKSELDGEPLLLGNQRLCSRLDGEYLGGFDRDRELAAELYRFRALDPFE